MSKEKVLVVEDEEDILELLRFNLAKEGFSVSCAVTGEEALKKARLEIPDLVLLDLLLPGIDGLQVAGRLKEDPITRHIPIVMLTAKGEEADIVTGLELGADDYITKPFSKKVLVARLRAVLRRRAAEAPDEQSVLSFPDLGIHPGRREVLVKGKAVALTYTEFGILHLLARRPGWVFTRNQIVDAVKGDDYFVTDRAVDVQIVGLRKKLGPASKHVETVRGVGYRFRE
ncbi:MAG: response regulator [Thermodesulfobacteriota bacterium]